MSNEIPALDGLASEGLKLKAKIAKLDQRLKEIAPDLIALADGKTLTHPVPKLGKVTVTAKTETRQNGTKVVLKFDKIPENFYPLLRKVGALVDEPVLVQGSEPQVRYTLNA